MKWEASCQMGFANIALLQMFKLDLIFEMKFINADQDEDTLSSIGELGISRKWKRTNENC